jgi:GntR family transcriptional regulator/MocR family aminotransferase
MISLLAREGTSLSQRLVLGIRGAILKGLYKSGEKIPSSRELQKTLKISRSTVIEALEQLIAEGFLVTAKGKGTFVNSILPDKFILTGETKNQNLFLRSQILSNWNQAPNFQELYPTDSKTYVFRPGLGALDHFPAAEWSRLVAKHLRKSSIHFLGYNYPAGIPELRRLVADHVSIMRGSKIKPEQVIITSGAQQAFQLALSLIQKSNQTVYMEEPGYGKARAVFERHAACIKPMPIDQEGASLPKVIDKGSVVFLTPSFQYPLGIEMTLNRRFSFLEAVTNSKSWIIEDDYDCEFRYDGRPTPSIFSLSGQMNVLYCLTFSKSVAPALRLGCLVVPEELADDAVNHVKLLSWGMPLFIQKAFAEFIAIGAFNAEMRKARKVIASRQQALVKALQPLEKQLEILSNGRNGLHVTVALRNQRSDRKISARAIEQKLHLVPLSSLYANQEKAISGFLLGFGAFSESKLQDATKQLVRLVSE